MSKLSQLEQIRRLGLPTPKFVGISFQDFSSGRYKQLIKRLKTPLAVRSSFSLEDGQKQSFAGHFLTKLSVDVDHIESAIQEVFDSYPSPHGQHIIVQEMLNPQYSGVLFAFRQGIWKIEYVEGLGEKLVGGQLEPHALILPKFLMRDVFWSSLFKIWKPFAKDHPHRRLVQPLIKLAACVQKFANENPLLNPIGLDVEFAVANNKPYLLQARPLTSKEEAEELLTSANHKEILPPIPSRMMTSIIASSSKHLFSYYQRLDPKLPSRNFIEISAGMPWINLSALLDTMVAWGLPTSLVTESVGADDVYRVKSRPYQMLKRWPVFLRVIKEQLSVVGRTRRWVRNKQRYLLQVIEKRRMMWRNAPDIAFNNWQTDLQVVYVELVALMQALTGAMSGPMKLFSRLGWLQRTSLESESTQFLNTFAQLAAGEKSKEQFLKEYGHRGFYESDIGQKRFREYSEEDWAYLVSGKQTKQRSTENEKETLSHMVAGLTKPFFKIMTAREWLRHHAMRYFDMLRMEIVEQTHIRLGEDFDFSQFSSDDLQSILEGQPPAPTLENGNISGWDMDTFLWNQHDRRLPLSILANGPQQDKYPSKLGLGIYPGRLKGQIWKVDQAALQHLQLPDYENIILLTESLDPGWIPFFVKVDGVLSHVGGILSHASIILRESKIPSITRVPRLLDLSNGDWVEMDGRTGEVHKLNQHSHG